MYIPIMTMTQISFLQTTNTLKTQIGGKEEIRPVHRLGYCNQNLLPAPPGSVMEETFLILRVKKNPSA